MSSILKGYINSCFQSNRLTRAITVAGLLFTLGSFAQGILPPNPYVELSTWSFEDTNWYSDLGYAPISFTNLNSVPSFDGNAVQVDSPDPAWLQYNIIEADGTTNLSFSNLGGTIQLWVLPDWNSGTGPGDWGRLIEVGAYDTNSPSSWWSLYFSPDGTSLNFSSETNGIATNYLSCPISWDTNTWHFIALTYNRAHSALYIDGQLATNGAGMRYKPSQSALTNGFFVGSDYTGLAQARVLIDDMATYDYARSSGEVTNDYATGLQLLTPTDGRGGLGMDSGSGGFSIGGSDSGGGSAQDYSTPMPDYGTNLWIAQITLSSGYLTGIVSNTQPDILYELQCRSDLIQGDWISYGFFNGSELVNWSPANVPSSTSGNLFLRIRSWQDSNGSGIPDWWWLTYFGQDTNVDANASAAGDGYSNLQKFQMGLNPTNYYNTNPPAGFFGCLDGSGTNIVIEWNPSPGPVVNYVIQRGIQDINGNYSYAQIGVVSSNAIFFKDVGAMTNANAENNIYNLWAVYPDGSSSGTNSWTVWWYIYYGNYGPPNGPPQPNDVYAYAVPNGTNVVVSWTPAWGSPTNYQVVRGVYNPTNSNYAYAQIAAVSTNTMSFQDTGAIQGSNSWNNQYEVEAVYPGGGLSLPVSIAIYTNPPPPIEIVAHVDSTGTNVAISWSSPIGFSPTNYVIERGVYNTNTSAYDYSQIGSVNGSTTNFVDMGAITGSSSYYDVYQVKAMYPGGAASLFVYAYYPDLPPPAPNLMANMYLAANLVRNETGRWQVMFSSLPVRVQSIQLTWVDVDNNVTVQNVAVSTIANGIYSIPDSTVVNLLGDTLSVQGTDTNGNSGPVFQVGTLPNDAPYFVDGRQHLKQNLSFLIRGASNTKPFFAPAEFVLGSLGLFFDYNQAAMNQSSTNFEEFSFLHHGSFEGSQDLSFYQLDNLWPFTMNYDLANYFVDLSRTNSGQLPFGDNNFTFAPNFTNSLPASPVLTHADPYWILQPRSYDYTNWNVSVTSDGQGASLAASGNNFFNLSYGAGCMIAMRPDINPQVGLPFIFSEYQTLNPGSSVNITPSGSGYIYGCYASWCPAPTLQLVDYYSVALVNPSGDIMNLPGAYDNWFDDQRTQPVTPLEDDFNVTNQTSSLIIASVGQPMIMASWAKYSIQNGSTPSGKYAYLGQYFNTNALSLNTSGTATTNRAGILSPYGEFFPTTPGAAALVTMPDIDPPYQQGTGIVRVVSLNVDANHDGTMDFTYQGPDFVSTSKPFRFWANDNQDIGDFGGNYGVPGQIAPVADGYNFQERDGFFNPIYRIHGTRDLVDFFPVCLNISSLFQSNALSAGISATDTNYQFVLSQTDGVLRFAYTSLTSTNYMNYLRDTNVAIHLGGYYYQLGNYFDATPLKTISSNGVVLKASFVAGIAASNQSIILVESAAPTTQPLVLTIYHGTNQIAQTSLPLSISGVEQMFRHKNLLLSASPIMPDRLTDASVTNEPDTVAKYFVFIHGYNVNPNDARGVAADMFKRMYWSGSHAKFYAVTWEGADTKISDVFTPNYHTNVVNAFLTAPYLANFITSLTNSGPVVVAAHSLGNMLTLSAISDWSAPISQYFMIDSAVPIEAIDPTATTNMMIYSTWTSYSNRLYASQWSQLFPTNDARSSLTWSNRLGNLGSVDVYNFYSSGEEVLRTYTTDPPSDLFDFPIGSLWSQIRNHFWSKLPFGTYSWYWQEKGKGSSQQDWLLGSSHGGWKFSTYWVGFWGGSLSPATMNGTSPGILQTNPMFNFASTDNNFMLSIDVQLGGTGGSAYAQANHNRILADAIPAMSLVAGANPIPSFDDNHNKDMMNFENGWAQVRLATNEKNNNWYHSDFVQMAYTFTHQLFDTFVTTGNLK